MSTIAALPPSLRERIVSLAGRIRLLRALRGISVLLLVLLLGGSAALLLDYWLGLGAWLRCLFLASWLGLGTAAGWFACLRPLCRDLSPDALAALIEEKYPDLGERLTSVVELAGDSDTYHGARAFIDLLTEETAARSQRLDFLQVVPARHALRLACVAGLCLVLVVASALLWPRYSVELSRRFFLPWRTPGAMILYALEIRPGDVVAAKGRPLVFHLRLLPENDKVSLPRVCHLVLSDAEGKLSRVRMLAEQAVSFSAQLERVAGDFRYHVEAGDAVSDAYQVIAVEPVDLGADSPAITITPPAYAQENVNEEKVHGLADLSALQHSRIRFDFRFTRPAAKASLEWTAQPIKKDEGSDIPVTSHSVQLADDGLGGTCEWPALANGTYRLLLEDEHGIRTELEPRVMTVKLDQPPTFLQVVAGSRSPLGKGKESSSSAPQGPAKESTLIVLPYDSIPLDIVLADDVGVEGAEVEYRINEGRLQTELVSLEGAGSLQASSRHVFRLADKVLAEGDAVRYRIKAADNRRVPEAGLTPHVIYYPPGERWLTLKISHRAQPLQQQEIATQRKEIDQRLESIKRDLLKEQRNLAELRPEARQQSPLNPEQLKGLKQLGEQNRNTEDALRELARDTAAVPALQTLAEQARDVADQEMSRSAAELSRAEKEKQVERRDQQLRETDKELTAALNRVDEMRRANDRLAQAQSEQAKLEMLAEREQSLAERATQQASRDPAKDPLSRNQVDQLKRDQGEVAKELQRLAEQSEPIRTALDAVRADQARQMAERARALAREQHQLAEAGRPDRQRESSMEALARKQEKLAERAAQMAEETRQAAQVARARPLKPQDAQMATQDLRQQNAGDAMRHQEQAAREMERLATELNRASEQANDPREAAHQLARLQESLRQNLKSEGERKDARTPLRERVQAVERQQESLRQAASKLPVPERNEAAQKRHRDATEQAGKAVEALKNMDPPHADALMKQAKEALEQLANQMPAGQPSRKQPEATASSSARGKPEEPVAGSPDLPSKHQADQARALAKEQRELRDEVQRLVSQVAPSERQSQQQAKQQALLEQTRELNQDLGQLARQTGHLPAAQQQAQRATESGKQAGSAMQQAQDQSRQSNQGQAHQAQEHAAQRLDQVAQQTEMAAQRIAEAVSPSAGQPSNPESARQTGQAVQQAQSEMSQAQGQLTQGQHHAAQAAMQRASQALQQAAQQLAQKPGQMSQERSLGGGVVEGGTPNLSQLGPDAKKYAGKRWGELPGELRTKIIQDMEAKYGEDYARIIKLYFEQIADTKK